MAIAISALLITNLKYANGSWIDYVSYIVAPLFGAIPPLIIEIGKHSLNIFVKVDFNNSKLGQGNRSSARFLSLLAHISAVLISGLYIWIILKLIDT